MTEQHTLERSGPLQGLKVVEFAHIMAGPVCGMMLADMGADVIKIERIPGGDDTRRMVPPGIEGESPAFMIMNRGKRGLAVNLKTEEGRALIHKLVEGADILIENYRRGTMEKLGLGWEAVHGLNPRLIYCSLSGFGRTGPFAAQGGFDLIAQGYSGLMSVTGEGPGRQPVKVGGPVTDITAGILGAMGILAALHERQTSGLGQLVDTSLMEAGIVHTYWHSALGFAMDQSPGPMGSAHPLNAPYQAFETRDGWINVGAANQSNWLKLLDVLEADELRDDPRFDTNTKRLGNLEALSALLTVHFKERKTAEWLRRLEEVGCPAGPVLSIKEMQAHPQTLARDMVVAVEHSRQGTVKTLGAPVKFSRTPSKVAGGAPVFGQHTSDLLAELGYTDQQVQALRENGVIAEEA